MVVVWSGRVYWVGFMTGCVFLLLDSSLEIFFFFVSSAGSMICVGRSNYFRFNHPEEAERMKTILPNAARISSVPMNFATSSTGSGTTTNASAASPEPPGIYQLSFWCLQTISANARHFWQSAREKEPIHCNHFSRFFCSLLKRSWQPRVFPHARRQWAPSSQ